jgi:hypothetical protein
MLLPLVETGLGCFFDELEFSDFSTWPISLISLFSCDPKLNSDTVCIVMNGLCDYLRWLMIFCVLCRVEVVCEF